MSLYRYVPGKGELLDLMLDHVNGPLDELEQHRGKPWRDLMEFMVRGIWDLYQRHPWLLQVNQSRPILGPRAPGRFDFALAGLDGLGLTGQEKIKIVAALENLVSGTARTYVLQQQAIDESCISDEEFWVAQEPFLETAIETGDYPELARLPDDAFSIGGTDMLEFGVRALLDGVEAFIAARQAGD